MAIYLSSSEGKGRTRNAGATATERIAYDPVVQGSGR
jgi:hypothetical protein